MANEVYVLKRLAERGVKIAIPILEPEAWEESLRVDPALPATYPELSGLAGKLIQSNRNGISAPEAASSQQPTTLEESCGESLYAKLYQGLGNPHLDKVERDSIDAAFAEATPVNWQTRSSPHFLLRWTDSDPDPAHHLTDPTLIDEAVTLLETAWQVFTMAFGREPFGSAGGQQIQVDFLDLGSLEGQAFPPEGPIQLNAAIWQARPELRAPLAAHELFHKLQYAFGFRREWAQSATDVGWLSEGTARWSEVFVHQRLTASKWLVDWLHSPSIDFFATDSFAVPFWIFFDAQRRMEGGPIALLDLLTACQAEQDARLGLERALFEASRDLPEAFAAYNAAAWLKEIRRMPNGHILYPVIVGPDGQPIDPLPAAMTVQLDAGGIFESAVVPLGAFGCCYHLFTFAPSAAGRSLRLEARSDGAPMTFQVLSLLGGQRIAGSLTVSAGFVHQQTIQLDTADAVVLVISGRGVPVGVEVGAQVT